MRIVRTPGPGAKILKQLLAGLSNVEGKVGWLKSEKYPDGTPVAYVATIQEYGYPEGSIPARPMLRSTIKEKTNEWRTLAEQGAKAILKGNETSESAMEKLTLKSAGDIRETISTIQSPPLKPATILARKRKRADKITTGLLTKPLVDTGRLLASVTNVVSKKK